MVTVDGMDVPDIDAKYTVFRQELAKRPEILDVAGADNRMGQGGGAFQSGYKYKDSIITLYSYFVDANFTRLMHMQLIAGRELDPAVPHEKGEKWLINETMARAIGLTPATAVGQRLTGYGNTPPLVVGVVKDFDFSSDMRHRVEPVYFHTFQENVDHYWDFYVRIRPGEPARAMAAIEAAWKKAAPGYAMKYSFVDEDLEHWYAEARRMGGLS